MSVRLSMLLLIVASLLGSSAPLEGTPLPESYPLAEAANDEANPVDPNLTAWLAEHVERPSPFEMEPKDFDELLKKQDIVTALYLKLARATRAEQNPPGLVRGLLDETLKQLAADLQSPRPVFLTHPLTPFLYLEMLKTGALKPEEQSRVMGGFAQVGTGTCAQKQLLYDEITRDNVTQLSDDGLRDLLARIDGFRSANFKKSALRRYLAVLPEPRQGAVADKALAIAQPYPVVVKGSPWLRALAEKSGKSDGDGGPFAAFEEARHLAGKRLCSKAKGVLTDALKDVEKAKKKPKDTLDDAVTAAKAIDGCYRARDPQLRADFWKNLLAQMEATYGFDGWAESKLRLGYIHWSGNEYNEAKPLFQDVLGKTDEKKPLHRKYNARATFALARIADQEGDVDRAVANYKDYVTRYATEENFEEALMALVLLHVDKGEWDAAMQPLENLIAQQTLLQVDERSTSALSFALFWAGRIHLEQNRLKEAAESWRRVASEYYSTYYGAMGHYLLEQITGRRLLLQPGRTPTFRMHALREAFAPEDRQQVKRVEALMRVGAKSEAICELEELDTADGKPEKLLVKALMLHASGQWLDAIKAYDALPRSFRNSQAAGLERILFPIKYKEQVRELAKKAEVDPDLVLAIIRQESVFNPMARSPVGAMGLMQLMPPTASMEAKKLDSPYVTPEEKKLFRQRVSNPMNLLVADTNLAIGVHHVRSLLAKYGSPVYVLTSYNASPSATQRWLTNISTKDILAFIEKIPYKETRAYVKLVLRNYFYYKRWYGEPGSPLKHLEAVASPLIAMVKQETAKEGTAATPNH